ncbi:structural constituent of ribosome [Batrachochytrium dendrobatidis]|nr:structural constituent of ribosome [Batrachochytrium dendrobatidis]KAK5665859.1 structural constituent of ribosome [Batrachochytrium dendrobatidis]
MLSQVARRCHNEIYRSVPLQVGYTNSVFFTAITSQLVGVRKYAAPNQPEDLENAEPLSHFTIKPALKKLPDVRGVLPKDIELPNDPGANKTFRVMMRAIDLEHRVRHDHDGRTQLISKSSPNAIVPGSIVLIEYVASRTMAKKQYFAGVLMAIRRKGIMSSVVVRNYVIGTGVTLQFPVYSPMVQKIKVLQQAAPEFLEERSDDISWILKKPCPGVDYTKIDEMVARYRSAEDRLIKRQQQHM